METIRFKDFMDGDYGKQRKRGRTYAAAGITAASAVLIASDFISAAEIDTSGNIDARAEQLYYGKLLSFAKWAIILKGGWDTVNNALKEDFDSAKKSFFSYMIVFVILMGFPWALNEVEAVFA